MKKLAIAAALICAAFLANCAGMDKSVFEGGSSLTATVKNPVGPTEVYRAKNVYAAALQAFVDWRGYCYARPYAVLMADPVAAPVCQNRRAVVRVVQANRPKVRAAIDAADRFVTQNPTISAASVVATMWSEVNTFKATVEALR